jgi:membrane-bound serine protease (ClpP class)
MGRLVPALPVALLVTALAGATQTQPAAPDDPQVPPAGPLAVVAEYDGIIHPISAEFFDDVITRADLAGAAVTIFVLRTPGGLVDSTRTMVSRMITSRTPVVVFVGPSGARAASAGFLIALAADVAVMAPGTHIGAAHPVPASGGEQPGGETMAQKAASDVAAYARTLAEARGRNAVLAAEAVTESRAFTESEALGASPPLIDFIASSVDDLLKQLHDRQITRFDGRAVTLDTEGARIEQAEMTGRQRFLSGIAHPQIAYLLLTLGMLGLTVELWNPGAIIPGVIGAICLLLAFFAFQVLPVNVAGLLLIVFGIALLITEAMVPSFGILGIGGAVGLVIGSLMLTSEVPGLEVSYQFIVPLALTLAGLFLILGRLAVKAHRLRPVTGAEGLVGTVGEAITAIGPERPGQIRLHGEIWGATSPNVLAAGQRVRVVALSGLTLLVEPVTPVEPVNRE